jgi:hypothetical protein
MTKPQGHARQDSNGQVSDPPPHTDTAYGFLSGTLGEAQQRMIDAMVTAAEIAKQHAPGPSRDEIEAYVHELVTDRFHDAIKAAKASIAEYGFEGAVWEPEGSKRWNWKAAV